MELRLKDHRHERDERPVRDSMSGDLGSRMRPTPDEVALHALRHAAHARGHLATRRSAYTVRSRSWRLRTRIGAWVPSFGKLVLVGVIAGVAWVVMNFETSTPATPEQAASVLTGKDVAAWTGAFDFDPALSSTVVTRKLLGADSISSRYDSGGSDPVTLTCRAVLHATEDGARASFSMSRVNLLTDFRLDRKGEIGLLEMDDAHSWGDEVRAFQVTEGLQPIGHSFVARKGRRTYYVALQGVVVQPEWSFAAMLGSHLKAFETLSFEGLAATGALTK